MEYKSKISHYLLAEAAAQLSEERFNKGPMDISFFYDSEADEADR